MRIDWNHLEDAFELVADRQCAWLHRETGRVVVWVPESSEPDPAADGRHVELRAPDHAAELGWMEAFASSVGDAKLGARLRLAVRGRHAFRAFKDALLAAPAERARWFEHRRRRLREHILGWLEEHDLARELDEPPPWPGLAAPKKASDLSREEPRVDLDDDAVESGVTPGGAPFGLAVDEHRDANARHDSTAGWARARAVLLRAFGAAAGGPTVEVGDVRKVGEGVTRVAFGAHVQLSPDPDRRSGGHVVLLLRDGAPPEADASATREAALLAGLVRLQPPFRVPAPVGVLSDRGRPVLVVRHLPGAPLELRADRQPGAPPWEVVGQLAAQVHALPPDGLADLVPGHATRAAHARAEIEDAFAGISGEVVDDARAWAMAHIPAPDEPAVLLHGDLLGQTILVAPGEPLGLIDWEQAARGDPAYDLAIVTRGVRRPFQTNGGLGRLLDAYGRHGGRRISRCDVRLHELCLNARWLGLSRAGQGVHSKQQALDTLRAVLRQAVADGERDREA